MILIDERKKTSQICGSGCGGWGHTKNLGEEVRARVSADTGVELQWEIKRIGKVPAQS